MSRVKRVAAAVDTIAAGTSAPMLTAAKVMADELRDNPESSQCGKACDLTCIILSLLMKREFRLPVRALAGIHGATRRGR